MMYHIYSKLVTIKNVRILYLLKKQDSVLKMHNSHVIIVYYIKKRRNFDCVHLNQIIIGLGLCHDLGIDRDVQLTCI